MNKLNFLFALLIGLGMVCGCSFNSGSGDSSSKSKQTRRENGTRNSNSSNSEKSSPIGRKPALPKDDESSSDDSSSEESETAADDSAAENNSSADKGDIAKLAGKWAWSRTGSGTYTTGGAYVGSNGSRFTYDFSEDGEVEYTGIMNVIQGSCRMQIFKTMKGEASLDGDTLTISWSPADFTRDDSCDTAGNYKKTLTAETETLQVAFKDASGQNQLCLTGKDETCFSPAE